MNDIRFESHCEHHMVPFTGKAHIAYLPDSSRWSASPSSPMVYCARRLQIQEKIDGDCRHSSGSTAFRKAW